MNEEEQRKIIELERVVYSLEHHLERYREASQKSKFDRIKKDREQASNNMVTHAGFIRNELNKSYVYSIIKDGSPLYLQFEDFWKYVESDTPDYIEKIKIYIKNAKLEGRDLK